MNTNVEQKAGKLVRLPRRNRTKNYRQNGPLGRLIAESFDQRTAISVRVLIDSDERVEGVMIVVRGKANAARVLQACHNPRLKIDHGEGRG
jgi:hypothetical protein